MKSILALLVFSTASWAQMPGLPSSATSLLKDKTAKVLVACKEDKAKVKGCESYTELAPLKTCLLKNKDQLSTKCKNELTLK